MLTALNECINKPRRNGRVSKRRTARNPARTTFTWQKKVNEHNILYVIVAGEHRTFICVLCLFISNGPRRFVKPKTRELMKLMREET